VSWQSLVLANLFRTSCACCGEIIEGDSRVEVKERLATHIRDRCLGGVS
jgi:hypothetical protein